MTHGEILFQQIKANPAGDQPRLVYVDWLEENGEADRAQFLPLE